MCFKEICVSKKIYINVVPATKVAETNPKIKRHRMPETSIIAASIAEMTIVFPKSGSFAMSSSGGKLVANIFQVVKIVMYCLGKIFLIMVCYNSSNDDN